MSSESTAVELDGGQQRSSEKERSSAVIWAAQACPPLWASQLRARPRPAHAASTAVALRRCLLGMRRIACAPAALPQASPRCLSCTASRHCNLDCRVRPTWRRRLAGSRASQGLPAHPVPACQASQNSALCPCHTPRSGQFQPPLQAEGRRLLALLLLLLLPSPRAVRASFACAAIGRRASREPRGPRGLSCNGSVEPVEPPTLAMLGPNHPARPATSPTPTCHDRLQPRWKTQIVMCARQVCRSVEMTIISFRIPGPELPMRNLCCQPAETAADDSSLLVARQ